MIKDKGSVATRVRFGGIFNYYYITNLRPRSAVNKL